MSQRAESGRDDDLLIPTLFSCISSSLTFLNPKGVALTHPVANRNKIS